ncbi:mitogen-activated protein kinase kinase kinase 7-like [Penaeus vannamei]|uniref:mitogen-activated protein kinase kinase kinase 7-like n=1 Tax=Penaeus vannamei TaxID=6689 RepID=UPI00387F6A94
MWNLSYYSPEDDVTLLLNVAPHCEPTKRCYPDTRRPKGPWGTSNHLTKRLRQQDKESLDIRTSRQAERGRAPEADQTQQTEEAIIGQITLLILAESPVSADSANSPRISVAKLSSKECKLLQKCKEVRLGKGTYGCVVRVSYKGKERALKLATPVSQVAFDHEMEMLRRLQGAGGAPVPLAYSEEPSCLLMTYLGKETLADIPSAQRSQRQLLQVSVKLAEAVAAGIVHCDRKPTNVMVKLRSAAGAPSVHVIDLGLALPVGQCHPASSKGRHSWYCACMDTGTPLTEKCDVVGVGMML